MRVALRQEVDTGWPWITADISVGYGTAIASDQNVLDPISQNLEQYMTLLSARQRVVASNIANADTPGYKTQDIDFQSELQSAAAGLSPSSTEVTGLRVKNDGNNVNLDRESRLLSENAMRFSIASNMLKSQLKIVHLAVEGGSTSA